MSILSKVKDSDIATDVIILYIGRIEPSELLLRKCGRKAETSRASMLL